MWDNPYLELRAAIPAKWTNRQRQRVDRAIIGAAVWFCFGEVEEHQHFSGGAAAGVTVTRWSHSGTFLPLNRGSQFCLTDCLTWLESLNFDIDMNMNIFQDIAIGFR